MIELRVEYAIRLLAWTDVERRGLEAMLQDFGERLYLRTIAAELLRHGVEMTPARIAQVGDAWRLQARARTHELAARDATSIMRTHNTLLRGMVGRILEAHPTYNRYQLVHALARDEDVLAVWKARQVNETERFTMYQAAFEDFYRDHSDLAALFEFGGSLTCPVCQEVADGNPFTLAGMAAVDDPPHVGCLDVWEPV